MKNLLDPQEEEDNNSDAEAWFEVIKDIEKIDVPQTHPFSKTSIKIKISDKIPNVSIKSSSNKSLQINNMDNLDASTAKKFRREEFPVEAALDLHGMVENQAYEKVISFVTQSYSKGLRAIIIVTGKGIHVDNNSDIFSQRAVLKNKVPEWLNRPDIKPMILSYIHPSQKLGGSGALYILLRRKRN